MDTKQDKQETMSEEEAKKLENRRLANMEINEILKKYNVSIAQVPVRFTLINNE